MKRIKEAIIHWLGGYTAAEYLNYGHDRFSNGFKSGREQSRLLRVQKPFDTVSQMMEHVFPELKESDDEKIRKEIKQHILYLDDSFPNKAKWLAWLEKQCQTFTKKDVDDAYLKGVCDAKHELAKQCEPHAKDFGEFVNNLSEQFTEVSFAKISRIAVRVKKYIEQCNLSNAQSNCIWHDADETPVGSSDKQILVLFKDNDAMVVPVEDFESLDKQLKWAYINDLIR